MQLEEESKNMVNNVAVFKFKKEDKTLELKLDTPNFSEFIRDIIINNYEVSQNNLSVYLKEQDDSIDIEELKNAVIEIHEKYYDEISKFYINMENQINTYYSDDDELTKEIEKYIEDSKEA